MLMAILGDTHFGLKRGNPVFHDLNEQFYTECFFPTLRERGINMIFQTGDLFDSRKAIDFYSLDRCRKYFFYWLGEYNIYLTTYLGNHDIAYKNTLRLNSPELLVYDYNNVEIITKPTQTVYDGLYMDIIPWIVDDNSADIHSFIKNSRSPVCFGHFELTGFEMDKGNRCLAGMSKDALSGYDMVISGHFHHPSSDGHIFYVGAPCEFTWADHGCPRGFNIFDTETRKLEFVENPYKMFHKVEYTDDFIHDGLSRYKNRYVKIIVKSKTNLKKFDKFISDFHKAEPADLSIVEDFTDYSVAENLMENGIDQAESTHVLIDKYVDAVDIPLDKTKMKSVMRSIYNEAALSE